MSEEQKDERFIAAVKRELDRSSAALDALTVASLRSARLRAAHGGAVAGADRSCRGCA